MVSDEVLRESASWLLALASGEVSPDAANARFTPHLTEGRDIGATIAKRFTAFRDSPPTITAFDRTGEAKAVAVVRSGERLWEFAITVEPTEPHRIHSFRPRPVPADAREWTGLVDRLRQLDHAASSLPASLQTRIHQRLADVVADDRIPGLSCGIAVAGETVHREHLGTGDLRTLTPLTPLTPLTDAAVFRVGSVTKLVTALTVLNLVQDGRIDLDAPVAPRAGFDATVADLLLHRAGLPKDLTMRRDTAALRKRWPRLSRCYPRADRVGRATYIRTSATSCSACTSNRPPAHRSQKAATGSWPATASPARALPGRGPSRPPASSATRRSPADSPRSSRPPIPTALPVDMTADLDSVLALAGVVGRAADPLAGALLAHTAPVGPGSSFIPGAALLDRPEGPIMWRGGSTAGFTAEIMAPADGSAAVVLLGSSTPAEGLRNAAEEVLRLVRS